MCPSGIFYEFCSIEFEKQHFKFMKEYDCYLSIEHSDYITLKK